MSKKYTQEHEWLEPQEDGRWRVGITEFAQEQLGDIVMVELPEAGRRVRAGEECAVIESVKSASDVYAPAEGEIVAVNEALADNPALVNEEAEGGGWLWEMTLQDADALADLMERDAYDQFARESE